MTAYTSPDRLPAPDDYAQPADSPAAFQALANATQAALQLRPVWESGVVSLAGAADEQRKTVVTFAEPFAAPPVVILQALTGMTSAGTTQELWPSNDTEASVQINGIRSNTTPISVRWIALGHK